MALHFSLMPTLSLISTALKILVHLMKMKRYSGDPLSFKVTLVISLLEGLEEMATVVSLEPFQMTLTNLTVIAILVNILRMTTTSVSSIDFWHLLMILKVSLLTGSFYMLPVPQAQFTR